VAADPQPFAAALPRCGTPVLLDATPGVSTSALELDEKGPPRFGGGPGKPLSGFQVWWNDNSGTNTVTDARVVDECTIHVKTAVLANHEIVTYQADCGRPGGSVVYDTQDYGVPGVGMPMVPCLGIQSAT
jgi:hypothetical protein